MNNYLRAYCAFPDTRKPIYGLLHTRRIDNLLVDLQPDAIRLPSLHFYKIVRVDNSYITTKKTVA